MNPFVGLLSYGNDTILFEEVKQALLRAAREFCNGKRPGLL